MGQLHTCSLKNLYPERAQATVWVDLPGTSLARPQTPAHSHPQGAREAKVEKQRRKKLPMRRLEAAAT